MKLKKLKLKNFRSYKNLEIDFDDNINVIIGKNDVGKSTVMEALEIFFNNDLVQIQNNDLNIESESKGDYLVQISLSFKTEYSDTIIIDSSYPTNLDDEFLLDNNGLLTLTKEWDCSKPLKDTRMKYYLECEYPRVWSDKPLLTLKNSELKRRIKEIEELLDEHQYNAILKNANAPMRQALYKYLLGEEDRNDRTLTLIELANGDDLKSLKVNIDKVLPLFFLFQSDRPNRDSDTDVQNPLNIAIAKALVKEEIQEKLKEVELLIKREVEDVANKTLAKLNEMDSNIASTLKPDYTKSPDWKSIFEFSFIGDGIPLNKRGSGVRRLVLLNYFRAEAERQMDSRFNKSVIYAIEEPETSQHPNYQKILIDALVELAKHKDHQVLITTHTPNIAKMVYIQNIIPLLKDEKNEIIQFIDNDKKLQFISETLGLYPYFKNKVVVCLEGEFDVKFMTNINQAIPQYKEIIDLSKEDISLIPLTGGNLKIWVERHYLKNSNINEIHIYDSDIGAGKNALAYQKQFDKIHSREDNSYCFLTKKREMENYIHKNLIEKEFDIKCDSIINWNEEDIPTYIQNKTQSSKLNEKAIKGILNGKLTKQLTKEYLEEIDAFEEIKKWFEKIKEATRG